MISAQILSTRRGSPFMMCRGLLSVVGEHKPVAYGDLDPCKKMICTMVTVAGEFVNYRLRQP